jgi:histidinol-phosphatase (PHP family)
MLEFVYPGPGIGYSLHNHSVFSDGADSLEDMVAAGKNAGLKVLGISDHWVEPPYDGTDYLTWAMPHGKLSEYVNTLLELRKKYEDENFSLKIGLEVDFFFENAEQVYERLMQYPMDYIIGSVHYSGLFSVDHDIVDWVPLSESQKADVCELYWEKLAGAAEFGKYTFLGHLDLPKKFALIDNSKYLNHAIRVLDMVQKKSGAIELNTSGWFKQCGEAYPAPAILAAACERNIPVSVNADAHCAEHLQRNFAEGYAALQNAGYKFIQE